MAKKAFAWIKTNLCCCWCKKKQTKDLLFVDAYDEPCISGYPHIEYPIFDENLNDEANDNKNVKKSLASGDRNSGFKILHYKRRPYKCRICAYKSTTKKGLRWHMITEHKKDVQTERTVDAYGRPLNFFGDNLEKPPSKQNYLGVIYEGDDDLDEQMKWALNDSISMAASRGYFDSDTDDDDEKEIKHITVDMIQKMMMKPLKIQ